MISRTLKAPLVAVGIVFASGCGLESPGDTSGSGGAEISGTAAVGAPIAQARVIAKCSDGSGFDASAVTTLANGTFSGTVSDTAFPCALSVSTGTTTLHSFAHSKGTTNLTPLTDLTVALASSQMPADWLSSDDWELISESLEQATNTLNSNLLKAGYVLPNSAFDPFNQAFAIGEEADLLLDQLQRSIELSSDLADYGALVTLIKDGNVTLIPPNQFRQWQLGHEEYQGDVQDVFAHKMKEYIEANSNHTLEILPYNLVDKSESITDQARNGTLQFVNQSPGFIDALIPEAQIVYVPYLMPTNMTDVIKFFRDSVAINDNFPALYAGKGLELLKMYPEGEMVLSADVPITTPDDLAGKTIRVMSNPILAETYTAFGASPTYLSWSELYGALEDNTIQGQENPIYWIEAGALYEVSPNLTFTGHSWFTSAMAANHEFFNDLPSADQQLVRDAVDYAFDQIASHIDSLAQSSLTKIESASSEVTVTQLTDAQIDAFRQLTPQVEDKFVELTGDSGQQLLDQFKADLEAFQP